MSNHCAAPWRGLHVQVDGGISTCCAGGIKFGNINTHTLEEALSDPKLKEIRERMKSGELPEEYCGVCKRARENNLTSEMDWHNSLNKDFDIQSSGTDYQFPVIFDARWDNTCNSACTYCTPFFSSKWGSLLGERVDRPVKDHKKKIQDFFVGNSHGLKTVSMVGGEPLLLKQNSNLLDIIPENVTVDIITNLSTDVTKSKVFEKLLAKRKVHWHVSLENVEQRYEYVRQESKWDQLLTNLKIIGNEIRNPPEKNDHEIGFMSIFNLFNSTRLCEFKEFSIEAMSFFPHKFKGMNNIIKNIDVVWQNFKEPKALCLDHYGKDILEYSIVEIEKFLQKDPTDIEKQFFNAKIQEFKNAPAHTTDTQKALLRNFIAKNEKIFDNTGTFKKLWPELSFLTD
jgi:sulfatase maturation enzyme AslB (radical SAM superfamily)